MEAYPPYPMPYYGAHHALYWCSTILVQAQLIENDSHLTYALLWGENW